jgi:hypothetical protein
MEVQRYGFAVFGSVAIEKLLNPKLWVLACDTKQFGIWLPTFWRKPD